VIYQLPTALVTPQHVLYVILDSAFVLLLLNTSLGAPVPQSSLRYVIFVPLDVHPPGVWVAGTGVAVAFGLGVAVAGGTGVAVAIGSGVDEAVGVGVAVAGNGVAVATVHPGTGEIGPTVCTHPSGEVMVIIGLFVSSASSIV